MNNSNQEGDKTLLYIENNDNDKNSPFLITPTQQNTDNELPQPGFSALDRVKQFLPLLKKANRELEEKAKEDPNSVIIENVDENEPHFSLLPIDENIILSNLEFDDISDSDDSSDSSDDSDEEPIIIEISKNRFNNNSNEDMKS